MIAVLLAVLVILLGILVFRFTRPFISQVIQDVFDNSLNSFIDRLDEATRRHIEVAVVLGYADAYDDIPGLVEKLSSFGTHVVAATLKYRLDYLNDAHREAVDKLRAMTKSSNGSAISGEMHELELFVAHLERQIATTQKATSTFRAKYRRELAPTGT